MLHILIGLVNSESSLMSFKDKVCIITGGAVGLGRAFCEQLLKQGAFVRRNSFSPESEKFINRLRFYSQISLFDLDSDAGELCCVELQQQFGKNRAIFCHCDVTDYSQFEGAKNQYDFEWRPSRVCVSPIASFCVSESFLMTKDTFGRIDILVNNAEIRNDKFWELETDVNLVCQ